MTQMPMLFFQQSYKMDIKEAKYYKNGLGNVCGIKLTLMDIKKGTFLVKFL